MRIVGVRRRAGWRGLVDHPSWWTSPGPRGLPAPPAGVGAGAAGAVRPQERVPARRRARAPARRETPRGPARVTCTPIRTASTTDQCQRGQAPEQQVALEVRGRGEGADDQHAEHRQEEADQAAARVHGVADVRPHRPSVVRREMGVPRVDAAPWRRSPALACAARSAPCRRLAQPGRLRGPTGRSRPAGPVRRALLAHGAPAGAAPAARWRRWAAIRMGELSSPYPA